MSIPVSSIARIVLCFMAGFEMTQLGRSPVEALLVVVGVALL